MPAIAVDHLTRRFGSFTAVNNIEFEVPEGRVFGFLGPNGSGKTTTIRMLLGLLPPTAGTAYVLGQDIRQTGNGLRAQMGYMSQKFSLYRDLTVLENLRFFGRGYGLYGAGLRRRIEEVIEIIGLQGHVGTATRELSGGWAQRLALGAAILHQPRLIYLDEPTAGVDPVSRRAFWDLLYRLTQSGVTVFVTTHYMDEAEHCEQIAFIYFGDIIARGTPGAIVHEALPDYVLAIESDNPVRVQGLARELVATGRLDARGISLFGAELHINVADPEAARLLLTGAGIDPGGIHVQKPSLEDAFIALIQGAD